MKIFNYNPDTLEFISETLADESPLEPGIFLIPAFATNKELPAFNVETQVCKYINNEWVVLDKPILEEPVPVEPSAEELKEMRISEIKSLLYTIDIKSIRSLREGDIVRIQEWESQAQLLRDELALLV